MKEVTTLLQNISKKLDAQVLANCQSISNVLFNHYHTLVSTKKLIPIEQLTLEEKTELWKIANQIKGGTKQERIDYSKALYTLLYYQSLFT